MTGVKFTPKVYDVLKAFALLWLPALSTFYFTVGTIWEFPNIQKVVGTLAALDTFLGVALRISKSNYNKSDDMYDGDVILEQDENQAPRLNIDLRGMQESLLDKDKLVLKVKDNLKPFVPTSPDDPVEPPEDPRKPR